MIELSRVNKIYRGKKEPFQALYDVSLGIKRGELAAIMGRSGCGKTTLLNIIGFMDRMDSGQYLFDGRDAGTLKNPEKSAIRNREIGFVYQTFNLVHDMTALENVEMPLGYAGIGRKERKEQALAQLDRVGLSDKKFNKPSELSGGQCQRVAIARALVNHPKVILADEPTGNLDKKNGEEILNILCELNRLGVTVVLVTHDKDVAGRASRTITMDDGKIIE